MPFILRSIRKSKWYKSLNVPWLAAGELQADALSDLGTKDNSLSVWHVLDDKSNRHQLITALAATHQHITNFDYFLLDENLIHEVNIKIREIPGDTPDTGANHWHRDLIELSAQKLLQLAALIQGNAEIERIPQNHVRRFLADAMLSGRLDRTKIKLTPEAMAGIIGQS